MEHYLNCKKIDTAINRAKAALEKRAAKKGLYEDFGQTEVRKIADAFVDLSSYTDEMNRNRDKLQSFDNWCSTYTP